MKKVTDPEKDLRVELPLFSKPQPQPILTGIVGLGGNMPGPNLDVKGVNGDKEQKRRSEEGGRLGLPHLVGVQDDRCIV